MFFSQDRQDGLRPIGEAIVRATIAVTMRVPVDAPVVEQTVRDMRLGECKFADGKGTIYRCLYTADEARHEFGGRRNSGANVRTTTPATVRAVA